MIKYEDLNIGDIILIPKGTAIWSIKLQQTIVLYNDIMTKITHTTYDNGSIFVMPQIKIAPIMYIDFSYDKSKELTPSPITPEYVDDETFGELHYGYDPEIYTNNNRNLNLKNILNELGTEQDTLNI
jgi:hypothetical protein